MTLATFEELLTARGQMAVNAASDLAPTEATFLAAFDKLRKRFEPEVAKAALETVILRTKAKEKFLEAAKMYFIREALEQATHHLVASHRAKRFAGYNTVLDLGCGVGADAIALARVGCRVIAVERNPLRARIAKANVEVLGLDITVITADALTAELPLFDAIFCDPARREGGNRFLDPDAYSPSPRDVLARFPKIPTAFKLAPGLARGDLTMFDGEVEFVSLNGELKECTAWLGPLATAVRRATLLPSGLTLIGDDAFAERSIVEPRAYIYLPDAAIIRAGLEPVLATELGAQFIDGIQPLLTSDAAIHTPLAKLYKFDALITGSLGKLADALRERDIGRVTWMNLGSPREVETVRKAIKLKGTKHRTVILTKLSSAAAALIVERLDL